MVKPEDGIKRRVWNVAHMTTVTYERVNGVVHILDTVVPHAASIGVGYVRKWCVAACLSNQLVS